MYQMLLISLRNLIVQNFYIKIYGLYSNNKLYSNNVLLTLFYIFKFIPFFIVKKLFKLFNYQIIYEIDGIHTITDITSNHILPIILNFELTNDDRSNIQIINIKYYNSSIPLIYILKNNINNYKFIRIKYLNKGRIIDKIVTINDVKNLKLFNLFEN